MGIAGRKIMMVLMFFLLVGPAFGADVKIAWDAVTQNADGTPITDLAGYNVYFGTTARTGVDPKLCTLCGYQTKRAIVPPLATTYTITGLILGTTYFVSVTAFDTSANESGFSNEVSGPAKDYTPPADPRNNRVIP